MGRGTRFVYTSGGTFRSRRRRADGPVNRVVVGIAIVVAVGFVARSVIVTDGRPRPAHNEAIGASEAPQQAPEAKRASTAKANTVAVARRRAATRESSSGARISRTGGDSSLLSVPSSIAFDCSRDVTGSLISWIKSVPNGSTLSFRAGGCYRIDGSVKIEDRYGLILDGNGATFRAFTAADYGRRHFWFFGGGNLRIRNVVVRGAHATAGARSGSYVPAREGQHGFAFQGVQGAVLEGSRAFEVYGDGVAIAGEVRSGKTKVPSRNIVVRSNRFERTGRHGMSISWGERVTVESNYIGDIGYDGIDVETDARSWNPKELVFRNNAFGDTWLIPFAFGGPGFITDVIVSGNVMKIKGGTPVLFVDTRNSVGDWSDYLIEGNTFIVGNGPRGDLEFFGVSDVTVRKNTVLIPYGTSRAIVRIRDSHHVSVTDNRIRGSFTQILEVEGDSTDYSESGNVKF